MLKLTPDHILYAYRRGVFPMGDTDTGEIAWYLPDPRAVLPLDGFHSSRSLLRVIRGHTFTVTFDRAFEAVMRGCADRDETWISDEFVEVYGELHRTGWAHSVEAWCGEELAGGAYGIAIGAAFMAESMFHTRTDASKVALRALVERLRDHGFDLLDVQYVTPHLASLGAKLISASEYHGRLDRAVRKPVIF